MKIHQVGGLGFDSNIYLLIDRVIALIDTGTGLNLESVQRNLDKVGLKPENIKLIINTHCHFDHTGGNSYFFKYGAEVAIHESEADFLRKGDPFYTLSELFGKRLPPIEVGREFHDGDRIKLGEAELEVVHTPGHSQGSICLHEPNLGLLFSGDTVFCGGVGRTDLPTSDHKALASSLQKLSRLRVEKLYPGHGPPVEDDAGEQISVAIQLTS